MNFEQVYGQETIKRLLLNSVNKNRLPHALLFVQNEGFGAFPMALALSKYLLCKGEKTATDACNNCGSCLKVNKLIHPDLMFSFPIVNQAKSNISDEFMTSFREYILNYNYPVFNDWMNTINSSNKQANISREECNNIIKKLGTKSIEGKGKILLMWLPEYLGKQGNSLLKIIEEPPNDVQFILVSENTNLILPTILSRTQRVNFGPIKKEVLQAFAKKYPEIGSNEIEAAQGSIAQLIKLAETNSSSVEDIRNWLLACYRLNSADILYITESLSKSGREQIKQFLLAALSIIKRSYKNSIIQESGIDQVEKNFLDKFGKLLSFEKTTQLNQAITLGLRKIAQNSNAKISLFNLSLAVGNIIKQ